LARSMRDLLNALHTSADKKPVQIVGRHMGLHHYVARQIDADRLGDGRNSNATSFVPGPARQAKAR
jgi:hypothetical protein